MLKQPTANSNQFFILHLHAGEFLIKDEQDSVLNNTSVANNDPVINSFSKYTCFYFHLGLSLLLYPGILVSACTLVYSSLVVHINRLSFHLSP